METSMSTENPYALHPDCPDLARLGPNRAEASLRAMATAVTLEEEARQDFWRREEFECDRQSEGRAFTRRQVLAGAGAGLTAAALVGTQLATTRVSFGATADGTLINIFLRGGADGLAMICDPNDPFLREERPNLILPENGSIPLQRNFVMNSAFEPLRKFWDAGELAFVPGTSAPEINRSHFDAENIVDLGGKPGQGINGGWLDRTLEVLGPGTTFRGVGQGSTLQRSLVGSQGSLALRNIGDLQINGPDDLKEPTQAALAKLFTGISHPLADQATVALGALDTAKELSQVEYVPAAGVEYPGGGLGDGLREIVRLVKAGAGVRVAAIDMGGWDTHTNQGSNDGGGWYNRANELARGIRAALDDLGELKDTVTIMIVSEFGRTVGSNGDNGTDHGHGETYTVVGGKVAGGVKGAWPGLAEQFREGGDVGNVNISWDVMGSILQGRFALTPAEIARVFPGHTFAPIDIMQ